MTPEETKIVKETLEDLYSHDKAVEYEARTTLLNELIEEVEKMIEDGAHQDSTQVCTAYDIYFYLKSKLNK